MKPRRFLLALALLGALSLVLSACAQKTSLRFSNATECGTATITLTNADTGSGSEYTVDPGKAAEIEIEPNVEYNYEVTYPRQPDYTVCDSKRVTTKVSRGQTLNIRLESVRDPALAQPTPTSAE
jgi:hypothetical protein